MADRNTPAVETLDPATAAAIDYLIESFIEGGVKLTPLNILAAVTESGLSLGAVENVTKAILDPVEGGRSDGLP